MCASSRIMASYSTDSSATIGYTLLGSYALLRGDLRLALDPTVEENWGSCSSSSSLQKCLTEEVVIWLAL